MVNKKLKKKIVDKQKEPKNDVKVKKKKEIRLLEINSFANLNTLNKLRLFVTSIFLLSTLSILLIFANNWVISAILILISYLMVFVLMIKLLLIKKL